MRRNTSSLMCPPGRSCRRRSGTGRMSSAAGPSSSSVPSSDRLSTLSPCVGREGGDVDQRLDVRVAGRGVGDHDAAVGVADEHDRAADRRQEAPEVGRVGGDAAQRVGGRDDLVAAVLELVDDAVPAGGVGEGAVDEDDGRLARLAVAGAAARAAKASARIATRCSESMTATLWSAGCAPRGSFDCLEHGQARRRPAVTPSPGASGRRPAAVDAARLVARDVVERPVVHEARHQQLRRASSRPPGARPRRS